MKKVSAPLVIAKRKDGSDVYLYEGTPVPDGLADGEFERLADFFYDVESSKGESSKKSSSK